MLTLCMRLVETNKKRNGGILWIKFMLFIGHSQEMPDATALAECEALGKQLASL